MTGSEGGLILVQGRAFSTDLLSYWPVPERFGIGSVPTKATTPGCLPRPAARFAGARLFPRAVCDGRRGRGVGRHPGGSIARWAVGYRRTRIPKRRRTRVPSRSRDLPYRETRDAALDHDSTKSAPARRRRLCCTRGKI